MKTKPSVRATLKKPILKVVGRHSDNVSLYEYEDCLWKDTTAGEHWYSEEYRRPTARNLLAFHLIEAGKIVISSLLKALTKGL